MYTKDESKHKRIPEDSIEKNLSEMLLADRKHDKEVHKVDLVKAECEKKARLIADVKKIAWNISYKVQVSYYCLL